MNLTLRQLHLFTALARLKSITAVARHFHVTQPTVSMQMKELAESVGLPLYEVIGKAVYLTPAGLELEATARNMLVNTVDDQPKCGFIFPSINHFMNGKCPFRTFGTQHFGCLACWCQQGCRNFIMRQRPDECSEQTRFSRPCISAQ